MKRICVFCGSSNGVKEVYASAAKSMGLTLVRRGIGLVYGGGRVGLMGVIADTVKKEGGEVIGIIPEALVSKEIADEEIKDLRIVGSMHERKALMAELSDAFIALPGGFGTLEEFCEILTWAQLGFHRKACGLLNVKGFYDPLLSLFEHTVAEGFVRPSHRALILMDEDPERLLEKIAQYQPPEVDKWIELDET